MFFIYQMNILVLKFVKKKQKRDRSAILIHPVFSVVVRSVVTSHQHAVPQLSR